MLSQDVERYAALQCILGHKFGDQTRSLKHFANYAMAHGDEFVRIASVLAWAAQTPSAQQRRRLVAQVRRFALAMRAENPRHEVPPRDCVGRATVARRPPHIYTAHDIDRIMRAARQIALLLADIHSADAGNDARTGVSEQPLEFTLYLES